MSWKDEPYSFCKNDLRHRSLVNKYCKIDIWKLNLSDLNFRHAVKVSRVFICSRYYAFKEYCWLSSRIAIQTLWILGFITGFHYLGDFMWLHYH